MFRKTLFWIHLIAGLISGLSIALMCFTGTVLAFEKEIVAWAERDARRVEAPATATRLPLDELQRRVRAAQPEARIASIVIQNDPAAAIAFSSGRAGGFYVNPYTGEIRQPVSRAVADFMHTMVDLHRYLGFHGEHSRPVGKLINGICNLAFFVLAVTGLYLWMPRTWSWRAIRPIIWFRQNTTGKARDFNWHNAIGFWSAPILIMLTLTAVPISFQWGGRLINQITGTPPSATPTGPGGQIAPSVDVSPPAPGAIPLSHDALLAAAQAAVPQWQTLTLRLGTPAGRGGRGGTAPANPAAAGSNSPTPTDAPARSTRTSPSAGSPTENRQPPAPGAAAARGGDSRPGTPQALTFAIREHGTWPRTATTNLTLDPFTGAVLRRTGYAELNAAQQVRAWTRFLHTGEAVGPFGQALAGLASLGGVFLVYTGFALSWRRFFRKPTAGGVPARDAAASPARI
jgi:uncharacterized iron-regulated membrane protein